MLRIPLLALLSACVGQPAASPSPAPATPAAPAPDPAPGPPGPACASTAAEVSGIDATDPRVSAPHLVVVQKAARTVQVFHGGQAVSGAGVDGRACYRVGLGFDQAGHKQKEGDGRTPEGWYRTSDKPWSSFYAAIAVHYPNAADARQGAADGRIPGPTRDRIVAADRAGDKPPQTTALGGEILLHGGGSSTDWTLGCIALDDADIDDLRRHLPTDQRALVRILP